MRRHRRLWGSSPRATATDTWGGGLGPSTALPPFNFIEPKRRRESPGLLPALHGGPVTGAAATTAANAGGNQRSEDPESWDAGEELIYHTLRAWASAMDDPTLSEDSKVARLWGALTRQSEGGRLRAHTAFAPNGLCSALALALVQRLLLGAKGLARAHVDLLVGALGNALFVDFDPAELVPGAKALAPVADRVKQLEGELARAQEELAGAQRDLEAQRTQLAALDLDSGATVDKLTLATAVYRSIDPSVRLGAITETLEPFLSEELLLLIWNATAKRLGHQRRPLAASRYDRGGGGGGGGDEDDDENDDDHEGERDDNDDADDDDGGGGGLTTTSSLASIPSMARARKHASRLVTRVLQERVRLLLTVWQTLSAEERELVAASLTAAAGGPHHGAVPMGHVLRTLEELYIAEQQRQQLEQLEQQQQHGTRRLTAARAALVPLTALHGIRRGTLLATAGTRTRASVLGPRGGRSRRRLSVAFNGGIGIENAAGSSSSGGGDGDAVTVTLVPAPANVSIPDVLLGALADGQRHATLDDRDRVIEELSAAHDELLRECEEVFDLLCQDAGDATPVAAAAMTTTTTSPKAPVDVNSDGMDGGGDGEEQLRALAKQRLCELLCANVEAPSFVLEKYERSEHLRLLRAAAKRELDDGHGTNAFVQSLIHRQRQNPMVLVNAINQSPEVLLSAIAQNPGILQFAITKFAPQVKRFLKLELKSCEFLDALAHKNKGVQLLWGMHAGPAEPSNGGSGGGGGGGGGAGMLLAGGGAMGAIVEEFLARTGAEALSSARISPAEGRLMEWFIVHTPDLAALALKRPELLKQLFVELHAQGDVSAFYKLMVQLGTAKGVQNYIHRASVATLEKLAQEDSAEISRVLRELLREPVNRDLLHQLQMSPYLATCLSEFHPTAIQDVISSDMDAWYDYFVEVTADNDKLLRESLATRTEKLDGGDALVKLFNAVIEGNTAGLNLELLDFGASPSDVAIARERESSTRRKMLQCLYLRGVFSAFRAVIAPQIATVGFHPALLRTRLAGPVPVTQRRPTLAPGPTSSRPTTSSSSATGKPLTPVPPGSSGGSAARFRNRKPPTATTTTTTMTTSPANRRARPLPKRDAGHGPNAGPPAFNGTMTTSTTTTAVGALSGPDDGHHRTRIASVVLDAIWLVELPHMWQTFIAVFERQRQLAGAEPPRLSLGRLKTVILDVWLEFVKLDLLQLDNACLVTLGPFVCDYFVTRYESPGVVGAWLYSLVDGLHAFADDPRVAFFAVACGLAIPTSVPQATRLLATGDAYDTFLYYAHALQHLFFGQAKIFKPECRLEETPDGSCAIDKRHVANAAAVLFDHRLLGGTEIDAMMHRLEALASVAAAPATTTTATTTSSGGGSEAAYAVRVELDDVLTVFLDQWQLVHSHVDDRYKQVFALHDGGRNRVGLEGFVRIVTTVTHHRVSPRECLLVYCDVGEELLDLETLLRVTRVYHLRLFNPHLPELALEDQELTELRSSVGRANIYSIAREVEDLQRYWRGVRLEVQAQVEAAHQTKATKMHLRKQSAGIEKLLHEVQHAHERVQGVVPPGLLARCWHEIRACVKTVHSAKVTQHYLSRLYIQSCLVRWIRHARRRAASAAHEERSHHRSEEDDEDAGSHEVHK